MIIRLTAPSTDVISSKFYPPKREILNPVFQSKLVANKLTPALYQAKKITKDVKKQKKKRPTYFRITRISSSTFPRNSKRKSRTMDLKRTRS